MILSILIITISLFFDGLISNYISTSFINLSIFNTDFTLLSLLITYKVFKEDKNKYLIILLIKSILYDLMYTNILFLHTYLYLIMYLILNKKKNINILTFMELLLLYKIIYFILLFVCGYVNNFILLISSISSSIISNLIYIFITYFLLRKYYKRNKINYR